MPNVVVAGNRISIPTTGQGEATFYLAGPGHSTRRQIRLGKPIEVQTGELRSSGRYVVDLCSQTCSSTSFYVAPASVSRLSFLVHPSRVPVRRMDAISGVAFPFDKFHNLVLAPIVIDFQLTLGSTRVMSRAVTTQNGIAWFRTGSGDRAGTVHLVASVNDLSVSRVVQQVASEPCNLRITAQQTSKGILVETAPVRDCAGNAVPDGTIVTFSATDAGGKTTVDTPIKQGIARASIPAAGPAVISVASGVVMGNELRMGVRP